MLDFWNLKNSWKVAHRMTIVYRYTYLAVSQFGKRYLNKLLTAPSYLKESSGALFGLLTKSYPGLNNNDCELATKHNKNNKATCSRVKAHILYRTWHTLVAQNHFCRWHFRCFTKVWSVPTWYNYASPYTQCVIPPVCYMCNVVGHGYLYTTYNLQGSWSFVVAFKLKILVHPVDKRLQILMYACGVIAKPWSH